MNITRRGLLGMFAAGAAAAVLPSGVAMLVRPTKSGLLMPDNPVDLIREMIGDEQLDMLSYSEARASLEEQVITGHRHSEIELTLNGWALGGLLRPGDTIAVERMGGNGSRLFRVSELAYNVTAEGRDSTMTVRGLEIDDRIREEHEAPAVPVVRVDPNKLRAMSVFRKEPVRAEWNIGPQRGADLSMLL